MSSSFYQQLSLHGSFLLPCINPASIQACSSSSNTLWISSSLAWKPSSIWRLFLHSLFQQFFFILQHIFLGFHFPLLYGFYPCSRLKHVRVVNFIDYLCILSFLKFIWTTSLLFADFCTFYFLYCISDFIFFGLLCFVLLYPIYAEIKSYGQSTYFSFPLGGLIFLKSWSTAELCIYLFQQ